MTWQRRGCLDTACWCMIKLSAMARMYSVALQCLYQLRLEEACRPRALWPLPFSSIAPVGAVLFLSSSKVDRLVMSAWLQVLDLCFKGMSCPTCLLSLCSYTVISRAPKELLGCKSVQGLMQCLPSFGVLQISNACQLGA